MNYDEIIENLDFNDIIRIDDDALKYVYAVKKANSEERAYIFKSLSGYKSRSGDTIEGFIKYDNASHEGIPFYTEPLIVYLTDTKRKVWINREGNVVEECPFVIDKDGHVKAVEPSLKK